MLILIRRIKHPNFAVVKKGFYSFGLEQSLFVGRQISICGKFCIPLIEIGIKNWGYLWSRWRRRRRLVTLWWPQRVGILFLVARNRVPILNPGNGGESRGLRLLATFVLESAWKRLVSPSVAVLTERGTEASLKTLTRFLNSIFKIDFFLKRGLVEFDFSDLAHLDVNLKHFKFLKTSNKI